MAASQAIALALLCSLGTASAAAGKQVFAVFGGEPDAATGPRGLTHRPPRLYAPSAIPLALRLPDSGASVWVLLHRTCVARQSGDLQRADVPASDGRTGRVPPVAS